MALVKTVIDGQEIEVERDRWALDVIREMGIPIPTLCYHPALAPYGACRLCVVEVTKGKWTWLTTSCDLPIREGLSIRTDTPAVIEARKMALELLWAEAPDAVEVQELARELGVERTRFAPRVERGKCILCGLCVRVCQHLVGVSALGFARRGVDRGVGTPFDEPSGTCIGCNACVVVCPTAHVRSIDEGSVRRMETWNTELEMTACEVCGRPVAPVRQLEFMRKRLPEYMPLDSICPACRRSQTVERLLKASEFETPRIRLSSRVEQRQTL